MCRQVHCVNAFGRLYDAVEDLQPFPSGLILHSWAGDAQLVKRFSKLEGIHFSISGHICSLPSSKMQATLKEVCVAQNAPHTQCSQRAGDPLCLFPCYSLARRMYNVYRICGLNPDMSLPRYLWIGCCSRQTRLMACRRRRAVRSSGLNSGPERMRSCSIIRPISGIRVCHLSAGIRTQHDESPEPSH